MYYDISTASTIHIMLIVIVTVTIYQFITLHHTAHHCHFRINLNWFIILKILQVCGSSTGYTWITIIWTESNILCSKSNYYCYRAYTNSITGIYATQCKFTNWSYSLSWLSYNLTFHFRVRMIHNSMHLVIQAAVPAFEIRC